MVSIMKAYHESPSNIAFIKYWGKSGNQIPMNPSLSMTLKNCVTKMSVEVSFGDNCALEVFLDNVLRHDFNPKIQKFIDKTKDYFTFTNTNCFISIYSENTFPHSSGIASSASAFSALAHCFSQIESQYSNRDYTFNEISSIARLGSGSACRSVEQGFFHWGSESNLFASKILDTHKVFNTLQDSILIVDSEKKETSSSLGHALMDTHPFKEARIAMAAVNFARMQKAMREGDIKVWGEILENEALTLHALMFSCVPSVILLKPNSLNIIEKIKSYRKETQIDCYFTIDAGANIHLLYFEKDKGKVLDLIERDLKSYCEDGLVIHDCFGGDNV